LFRKKKSSEYSSYRQTFLSDDAFELTEKILNILEKNMTEKEIINHDIDIYQDKPESSAIEILCGRAAKLAYLSAHDLNALFYDVTESLTEDSSICSQPYSTLETVGPLLQLVSGEIIILKNETTGCQVYIFEFFDEIWISFRGTQVHNIEALKKDILTDMKIEQQNTNYFPKEILGDVKIHTGFNESYLSVRDELLEILNKNYKKKLEFRKIRIIGHSLGGALATIMALDIIWNVSWIGEMRENVLVRTFGSPCVGNDHFVGVYHDHVIDSNRYFIKLDPVPLVLSEITRLDYFHVGNGIELDEMVGKHKIEKYVSCLIKRSYPELIETDNTASRNRLIIIGVGISVALSIFLYRRSQNVEKLKIQS